MRLPILFVSLLGLPLHAADAPKPAPPIVAPIDISEWTPRPAIGKGEPYERMKDPEWDDKRFQLTDTGPPQRGDRGELRPRSWFSPHRSPPPLTSGGGRRSAARMNFNLGPATILARGNTHESCA